MLMNRLKHIRVAMAAAAVLAPVAAIAAPAETAQIRALDARFAKAVAARDLDGVMKTYSPRVFVFDVIPPRQYVGAAAYREDWKGFLTTFAGPISFDVTDLEVSADGAVGYSHSIQHISGRDAKGGAIDLTVRVSDVYRKTAGGWKIVMEHVSVPVDLATGKADLASKP